MIKKILYISLFLIFSSCKKQDETSFIISLKDTNPTVISEFQQNIIATLIYEHPDGFVGFSDPDRLSLEIKDSRLESPDFYHLIPVYPPNHTLSITGEILIEIDSPFIFGNGNSETLTFTIRIQDKNNHWSNSVTTPLITVNE